MSVAVSNAMPNVDSLPPSAITNSFADPVAVSVIKANPAVVPAAPAVPLNIPYI